MLLRKSDIVKNSQTLDKLLRIAAQRMRLNSKALVLATMTGVVDLALLGAVVYIQASSMLQAYSQFFILILVIVALGIRFAVVVWLRYLSFRHIHLLRFKEEIALLEKVGLLTLVNDEQLAAARRIFVYDLEIQAVNFDHPLIVLFSEMIFFSVFLTMAIFVLQEQLLVPAAFALLIAAVCVVISRKISQLNARKVIANEHRLTNFENTLHGRVNLLYSGAIPNVIKIGQHSAKQVVETSSASYGLSQSTAQIVETGVIFAALIGGVVVSTADPGAIITTNIALIFGLGRLLPAATRILGAFIHLSHGIPVVLNLSRDQI